MEEKKVTTVVCVVCPKGCEINVEHKGKEIISVSGNSCGRGYSYAVAEATAPERILTTTVALESVFLPRLPVRSLTPIPRELIAKAIGETRGIRVGVPVKAGDILIENIAGSGVDLVACRTVTE